ncbi:RING-type domain-containing protein [Aphelenchoides fujianensis]|nr:RING-type domain-containing protein [Aphelenchoides fujianensis]
MDHHDRLLPPDFITRGTQTDDVIEPTTIEMAPTDASTSERASLSFRTRETLPNEQEGGHSHSDRPALQFNVEINSDLTQAQAGFEALNFGQTDSAAIASLLSGLVRNFIQVIGFKCLIPEAHPFNCILLFLLVVLLLGLHALVTALPCVLLGFARFVFYHNLKRFKMYKNERPLFLLLRVVGRNVVLYLLIDHTPYIDALCFKVVESNSFIYTLFVICMANLIAMDAVLVINVTLSTFPIARLQQKQLVKLVEYVAALLCSCLPVIQWYAFFANIWLCLPYLIFKMAIVASLVHRVFVVLLQCLRIDRLGTRPSKEELRDMRCIICYGSMDEDTVDLQNQNRCTSRGVKLSCGHIYGEQCLRNWLEEQNICPLCRKEVIMKYTRYPSPFLFPPYLM